MTFVEMEAKLGSADKTFLFDGPIKFKFIPTKFTICGLRLQKGFRKSSVLGK